MQTKVPCQQADIRAEKTFPESKLRGRRMEQSRGGNKATSPWNTCQKKDCTSTPQEAKELLYPVWTGKEFLSSTAACMKFTENGALLLFPQFEEISSHGPRIHFRLALYNGRNISERIKKKKLEKEERKAGGRTRLPSCYGGVRASEDGSRSEVSHIAFTHRLFHPRARAAACRAAEKQDWSTTFISALCKKLRLSIFGTRWIMWVEKPPLLWKSMLAC